MGNENTVLSIKGLTKYFGSKRILNNVSVEVKEGEILGFIGPNGSGKTTTIKVMLGLLHLSTGEIKICGHNIKTERSQAMSHVGGIIENPEMYKYLSGRQNLEQYRRMQLDIPKSRIDEVAKIVCLTDRINDKVGKYSLGMRQRLGLAQAIMNHPKLLVLDEPTNGLDPAGIKDLRDVLKRISREEGTAVFISSHQLAELDLVCDRIVVIDKGTVIAQKTIEEVRNMRIEGTEEFTVEITGGQNEKAGQIITELGHTFTENGNVFTVTAKTVENESAVPELLRQLIMNGIAVISAIPVHHSLEEAFMAVTAGIGETGKSISDNMTNAERSQENTAETTGEAVSETKEGSAE